MLICLAAINELLVYCIIVKDEPLLRNYLIAIRSDSYGIDSVSILIASFTFSAGLDLLTCSQR